MQIKMILNTKALGIGEVKAGKVIDIEDALAEQLIKDGHAIAYDGEGVITPEGSQIDLADLRVADLKDIAAELGVEGFASMNKSQLIEAIEAVEGGE